MDSVILGALLAALLVLRFLRLREQRARRRQVLWIAEDDRVRPFLASRAGDYRLTGNEVRDRWVFGTVLALLVSGVMGRLVSVWLNGPGTSALASWVQMLSSPPALALAGVVLGAGLVATHWSTTATHVIRAEYVEFHPGVPFGSWRLDVGTIARVGRESSGEGALVYETKNGIHWTVRAGEALVVALTRGADSLT